MKTVPKACKTANEKRDTGEKSLIPARRTRTGGREPRHPGTLPDPEVAKERDPGPERRSIDEH